jgi:tetratricopeptide (TPR) repeat protein
MTPDPSAHLHLARTGQRAALDGDHTTALARYREAMHLAVSSGAPEIFFRHYLESAMESLELTGELDSVLEYCDRAIAHYAEHPPPHDLARLDLAAIHQRRGVVLLKRGDRDVAVAALGTAVELAEAVGHDLELARRLLSWLRRGLTVTTDRVISEQWRCNYFSVREYSE